MPSRIEVSLKLTVPYYLLLRRSGAFEAYWKSELLDGELWGVPADGDDEPESDAEFPIKLNIEHYELLDRAGAFASHTKTELIDGRVYATSPQHRPHGFIKDELAYRLRRVLEEIESDLPVATEQSMVIEPFSEPQPNIILTTEPIGRGGMPVQSVALIVEVSDSTSAFDRKHKAALYAMAGVTEYWIADVKRRLIRQFWQPDSGVYHQRREIMFGETLEAATIERLVVATETLLAAPPS